MIRLLGLDLDGTTLNSKGDIPSANRDAIRRAEAAGVLVTIATGRRFRDAQPIGVNLELNAPLITHNGGLLKFAQSLETIAFTLLSTETSLDIIRAGKELGGDALVSTDPHGRGTLLYDRVSEINTPLKRYIEWATRLHGEDADASVLHVGELEAEIKGHEVVHISFSGTCDSMKKLELSLRNTLGRSVNLLATIYPELDFTLIDILPPDASKGMAVAKLAEINGIGQNDVMVVGDNFNDIEMLEFAGVPVVMGNADPSLRDNAKFYTTLSNDEGGVASAIDKFIFEKEHI